MQVHFEGSVLGHMMGRANSARVRTEPGYFSFHFSREFSTHVLDLTKYKLNQSTYSSKLYKLKNTLLFCCISFIVVLHVDSPMVRTMRVVLACIVKQFVRSK